jgi:geranylgeranyl transferase type-2 subunit alpha
VRMKGVPIDEELQFTTEKINENFSNYSAWHNRSALLSELYRNETGGKEIVQGRLEEEFDLVKNSFFTDPNDQSAWFYYSWLLGQVVAPVGPELNGSWPPHTSELVIKCSEEPTHLSITCTCPLQRVMSFVSSGVPLLLSFTEAVTGVNNETVTVHSNPEVRELSKLSWRPVGFSQEFSQTWATEVRFQIKDDKTLLLSELTNFTVDIEVAVVPGIVSPGGQPMQGPVKCSKVSFHFGTTDNAAKKTIGEELMAKQLGAIGLVEEETSKGENQTQIKAVAWQVKILETEIESILELLKIEPDRWIVTSAIYPSQNPVSIDIL